MAANFTDLNYPIKLLAIQNIWIEKFQSLMSNSATVPVSDEMFTPILYIILPDDMNSVAYPLSSICRKASSAEPSSLNSNM